MARRRAACARPRPLRVVDSHAHVAAHWYEPLELLDYQMRRCDVARAVLTQLLGQTDNAYIQTCRRAEPERYATIVLVDPAANDSAAQLGALARDGARGIRLRPGARSPHGDGLDIWRAVREAGLAASVPGSSADFAAAGFAELVAAFPDIAFVVEHLAGTSTPAVTPEALAERRQAFTLARFPNVYCKVPGLGEIAPRNPDRNASFPFVSPEPHPFDEALAAFGPQRLMWGSDFPVVASREGYAGALRLAIDHFKPRVDELDLGRIFGGTAERVFFSPR